MSRPSGMICAVVLSLAICGCSSVDRQNLETSLIDAQVMLTDVEDGIADFRLEIEKIKDEIQKARDEGAESKILDEMEDKGKDLQNLLDEAVKYKAVVEDTLVRVQEKIKEIQLVGDSDLGGTLQLLGAGAEGISISLPPNIGVPVGLIGSLLGVLGSILAKKKSTEAKTAKKVATNIVESIEDAKNETGVVDFKDPNAKIKISNAQGPDTIAFVRDVKKQMNIA